MLLECKGCFMQSASKFLTLRVEIYPRLLCLLASCDARILYKYSGDLNKKRKDQKVYLIIPFGVDLKF